MSTMSEMREPRWAPGVFAELLSTKRCWGRVEFVFYQNVQTGSVLVPTTNYVDLNHPGMATSEKPTDYSFRCPISHRSLPPAVGNF
jgi:hypothetical protein